MAKLRLVSVKPEERIRVHVALEDKEVEYILEADRSGELRLYAPPAPSPPVQDPDPISGT
jgi:hypothetical protein